MFIDGNDAFFEAQFTEEARKVFQYFSFENGMPVADVVISAVLNARKLAGVSAAELLSLTREELFDVYGELLWAMCEADGDAEAALPFGITASSTCRGSIRIGKRTYVFDAASPGLHEPEGVRRDAHGPNLQRLQERIRKKTAKLACRRLGLPEPVSIFDNEARHLLQFAPLEEAGGVRLQRRTSDTGADRFCAATPKQIAAFADSIVADMRLLWAKRHAVAARVNYIRDVAEKAVREADPAFGIALKAIAVDMNMESEAPVPSLYVEFIGLDEALRPGVILDYAPGCFADWDPRAIYGEEFRREDLKQLRALGADGWIEPIAAKLAEMAPGGVVAALAPLATAIETYIAVPTSTGPMHATLFWQNGTIRAEIDLPGRFSYFGTTVELAPAGLPDTVVGSLQGRSMATLFGAPLGTADEITDVSVLTNGGLRIRIAESEYRALRVDIAKGRVW